MNPAYPGSIMRATLENCSVGTKYFVFRWILFGLPISPKELKVDQFAKVLTLKRSLTGKALNELEANGYLSVELHFSGARGRPKRIYRITEKLGSIAWAEVKIYFPNLIEDLLTTDLKSAAGTRRHELKLPARVLLAVLLSYADEGGVVQSAGTAFLAEKVGVSNESIRNNIAKLKELGYIRQVCPGISSKKLIGTVGSAFVLNLGHSRWREAAVRSHLWLIDAAIPGNFPLTFEAYSVVNLARKSRTTYQPELARLQNSLNQLAPDFEIADLREIRDSLMEDRPFRIADRLQFELEMAASAILTQHRADLGAGTLVYYLEIVNTHVKSKIVPQALFENRNRACNLLIDLMYQIAWLIAANTLTLIKTQLFGGSTGKLLMHHPVSVQNPNTGLRGCRCFAVELINDGAEYSTGTQIRLAKEPHGSLTVIDSVPLDPRELDDVTLQRFALGARPI